MDTKQVGGTHYGDSEQYQHWDYCVEAHVPYLEAAATKYLSRWRDKNGIEDLKKAQTYVAKRVKCLTHGIGVWTSGMRLADKFELFLNTSKVPQEERVIIDTIMHWETVDQLIAAHNTIDELIEEAKAAEPGSTYTNQG